nr:hypothetical protein CFP56_76140 [Quercus suber]
MPARPSDVIAHLRWSSIWSADCTKSSRTSIARSAEHIIPSLDAGGDSAADDDEKGLGGTTAMDKRLDTFEHPRNSSYRQSCPGGSEPLRLNSRLR